MMRKFDAFLELIASNLSLTAEIYANSRHSSAGPVHTTLSEKLILTRLSVHRIAKFSRTHQQQMWKYFDRKFKQVRSKYEWLPDAYWSSLETGFGSTILNIEFAQNLFVKAGEILTKTKVIRSQRNIMMNLFSGMFRSFW